MTQSPGIEPGQHWLEASALTTAPSLLRSLQLGYKNTPTESNSTTGATGNRLKGKQ